MRVGWYVHHDGSGHLQRFQMLYDRLPELVGLSSLPAPPGVAPERWVTLPLDAPTDPGTDPEAGGVLHWAPLRHPGLRHRMARLAAWVESERPSLLVVDVSVEIALFARLMGVPVLWLAQRGRRVDTPHRLAYAGARVVAPWTRALASPGSGLPDSTRFIGAMSRFDARRASAVAGRREVLVLVGRGEHGIAAEDVHRAARATPGWRWHTNGLSRAPGAPVTDHGSTEDVWPLLTRAGVVVGSGGGNVVAEVAAARRPLVCLPQRRPFGEQDDQAGALARGGLAESLTAWPEPERWGEVLDRASRRDPAAWARLHDGHAADRLADAIAEAACASG